VRLANPYLDYFFSLPPECRRDPRRPFRREPWSPEWLQFKAAVARAYAWAVPTRAAVGAIAARTSRVVEVGCGSGYWAWLLEQAGVDVVAVDSTPPPLAWHPVRLGGEVEVVKHPDRTLFLCWPPWATDMAYNALSWYRGDLVVYVGEWMAGSAELRFFSLLALDYEKVERVEIPQWVMRTDVLTIWRRRRPTRGSEAPAPGAGSTRPDRSSSDTPAGCRA
jgi:SAM-dependent methyltransferase